MAAAHRVPSEAMLAKIARADSRSDSTPPSPVAGMRKAVSGVQPHVHMQALPMLAVPQLAWKAGWTICASCCRHRHEQSCASADAL
jgi:hypothetical protein